MKWQKEQSLTFLESMEFSIKRHARQSEWLFVIMEAPQVNSPPLPKMYVFLWRSTFVLANSADPGEKLHNAAFRLAFTVWQSTRLGLSLTSKVKIEMKRFPAMWYVRPAKAQTSLRIRAVWSEPWLVVWKFYDCQATDQTALGVSKLKKNAVQVRRSLHLSKCHFVGNLM